LLTPTSGSLLEPAMRYLAQRNSFTCAPVMFLNLYKWAGRCAVNSDIKPWIKKTRCTRNGSDILFYGKLIKEIPFIKVRIRNRPTLNEIDKELGKGNSVIVRSKAADDMKHLFLVVERSEKSFYCTNVDGNQHRWIPKEQFRKKYLSVEESGYPKVWFVRKMK
jgi:hypothetical protein